MKKSRKFVARNEHQKALKDLFMNLAERHGRQRAWSDFIMMSACAISNSCDARFRDEREHMYMSIAENYSKEELEWMTQMLVVIIQALTDNPAQDFLGEMFSLLDLHDEWKGQFFTPYHVGSFMAAINLDDVVKQLQHQQFVTVNDCCCGAGCLLLAFANEARKEGIDYQNRIIFVAQDLDYTAAMMCYIQLSFLGCRAIVKVGNSLTDPFLPSDLDGEKIWYTPMYTYGNVLGCFAKEATA